MIHPVKAGSRAPDFEYALADGRTGRLSELWAEGPLLLVWLRHCG